MEWKNHPRRIIYQSRPSLEWSYNKLELSNREKVVEPDQRSLVSQQGIQNFIDNYNKNNKIPLTEKQEKDLYKINDYKDNDIIKNLSSDEPIVMFFEGAGSHFGEEHLRDKKTGEIIREGQPHSKGRFGAMAVVVENGKIVFMSLEASTLPDKPQAQYGISYGHNTILPGVYYIKSDYAGGSQKHVGFATGRSPNPQQGVGDDIPVYRFYDKYGKYNPGIYDKGSGKEPAGSGDDIHAG